MSTFTDQMYGNAATSARGLVTAARRTSQRHRQALGQLAHDRADRRNAVGRVQRSDRIR